MCQRVISYNREIKLNIYYNDIKEALGTRRVDFIVERKVWVGQKPW